MKTFKPGLVHVPVTPFRADQSIDYDRYARVLDFHLGNGADALALPMPQGEDVSLTDAEQRALLAFAVRHVAGRAPVIAHAGDSGTAIAVARAKHAATLGAAAIASHPPYFWHPRPAMVVEHLVEVGGATGLPFFICTPAVEDAGTHLTAEIVLDVLKQLDNVAGLVDASMRFVFMVETISLGREIRPSFELLAGTDMMVPNGVVGGNGAFSPLAGIAPRLVRELYELCRGQQFTRARKIQEQLAELHHLVKVAGRSGLKGAMRALGRDCGGPRLPALPLGEAELACFMERVSALSYLRAEPRGW
ncbi:MAG: dihydrodipicolinate synthase family protein [Burkholderiales bacterium]|nr:dihydrodipicolinate synthase family protein [Burkholderiales bacterium]